MRDKLSTITSLIALFFRKTWIIFVCLAIIAAAGFSSVEIYKEEVLKQESTTTYKESGYLFLSSEALDTLNPLISQSEDTYYISKLIYNSLFDYDENLNLVPELVESYTVDTTAGKISIKLKEGITWHNGDTFTAYDVKFTVNAIVYAGSSSIYYEKASKIVYMYVKNNYEMDIYFRNAYNASLDDLTFPIVPSGQYSTVSAFVYAVDDFKPIGTGQYQYQSYNYLKQLRLKPFEDYFGAVATKKIKVLILPDKELSVNMLEIESVTCYISDSSDRKSTVTDKNFTMYDMVTNEVEFLVFNPESKLLATKTMRKAIAYAIDTENILENGYMGDGVLSDTIYYPNFLGVEDTGDYYSYDLEKSLELINKLGYSDIDGDELLEDSETEELTLTIIVNKNNSTRLAAAKLIKKDLEAAGFTVDLQELSWSKYEAAIAEGEYDILVTGYTINESYDLRTFYNGESEWGYYNTTLWSLANELEMLHTAEEYAELYSALKEELLDELPYYALIYKKEGLIGVGTFVAEELPTFNDIYRNCETWSWSYEVE